MSRNSLKTGCVIAAFVVGILLMANLPYQFVERGGTTWGTQQASSLPFSAQADLPVMAGWPLRYSIFYPSDLVDANGGAIPSATNNAVSETGYRYWSTPRLLGNIVFAVAVVALIIFSIGYREKKILSSQHPQRIRRRFDAGLAFAIVLLPMGLFGSAYLQSYRQQQVVEQMGRRRVFLYSSSWLPEWVSDQIPLGLQNTFLRIRSIQISSLTDAEFQDLSKIETLVSLDIIDGEVSGEQLATLKSYPHLMAVRLGYMEVQPSHLTSISGIDQLRRFSLSGSNVSDEAFRELDGLKHLVGIDLSNCSLPLASLGKPNWSRSCQELFAMRPPRRKADSIKIHGWPNLRLVSLRNSRGGFNSSVFDIDLQDLPALSTLSIDRLQLHDIRLVNLPRLQRISDDLDNRFALASNRAWAKSHGWMRNVEIDRLSSLKEISLCTVDLEELKLGDISALSKLILSSQEQSSQGGFRFAKVESDFTQEWIETVGSASGPRSLSLVGSSLAGMDLTSLTKNQRLKKIKFSLTGITLEQLKSIQAMTWMEELLAEECEIGEDDFAWFQQHFPNLRELRFAGGNLGRFDLTKPSELTKLSMGPLRSMQNFRLVGQPDFSTLLANRHLG